MFNKEVMEEANRLKLIELKFEAMQILHMNHSLSEKERENLKTFVKSIDENKLLSGE